MELTVREKNKNEIIDVVIDEKEGKENLILIGNKRAGKDYFASHNAIKHVNLKLAYPIKQVAKDVFDIYKQENFLNSEEYDFEKDGFREKEVTLPLSKVLDVTLSHIRKLFDKETLSDDKFFKTFYPLFNINKDKITVSPREFQQKYGTEICRLINENIFIENVNKFIESEIKSKDKQFVVTDCRFANELYHLLKQNNEAKIVYIYREQYFEHQGKIYHTLNHKDSHTSEKLSNEIEKIIVANLLESDVINGEITNEVKIDINEKVKQFLQQELSNVLQVEKAKSKSFFNSLKTMFGLLDKYKKNEFKKMDDVIRNIKVDVFYNRY